mmetsp:Transcript_124892/g.216489  ORF Transcript_124892/g.216489 Transcript_124892/m.216489 type:complete len:726 (-) Transcript_124892:3321-5498(-)
MTVPGIAPLHLAQVIPYLATGAPVSGEVPTRKKSRGQGRVAGCCSRRSPLSLLRQALAHDVTVLLQGPVPFELKLTPNAMLHVDAVDAAEGGGGGGGEFHTEGEAAGLVLCLTRHHPPHGRDPEGRLRVDGQLGGHGLLEPVPGLSCGGGESLRGHRLEVGDVLQLEGGGDNGGVDELHRLRPRSVVALGRKDQRVLLVDCQYGEVDVGLDADALLLPAAKVKHHVGDHVADVGVIPRPLLDEGGALDGGEAHNHVQRRPAGNGVGGIQLEGVLRGGGVWICLAGHAGHGDDLHRCPGGAVQRHSEVEGRGLGVGQPDRLLYPPTGDRALLELQRFGVRIEAGNDGGGLHCQGEGFPHRRRTAEHARGTARPRPGGRAEAAREGCGGPAGDGGRTGLHIEVPLPLPFPGPRHVQGLGADVDHVQLLLCGRCGVGQHERGELQPALAAVCREPDCGLGELEDGAHHLNPHGKAGLREPLLRDGRHHKLVLIEPRDCGHAAQGQDQQSFGGDAVWGSGGLLEGKSQPLVAGLADGQLREPLALLLIGAALEEARAPFGGEGVDLLMHVPQDEARLVGMDHAGLRHKVCVVLPCLILGSGAEEADLTAAVVADGHKALPNRAQGNASEIDHRQVLDAGVLDHCVDHVVQQVRDVVCHRLPVLGLHPHVQGRAVLGDGEGHVRGLHVGARDGTCNGVTDPCQAAGDQQPERSRPVGLDADLHLLLLPSL